MKRTKIERKTPLRSRSRPRTKKRSAAETTRVYGDDDRQTFLRGMPCLGCARMGTDERPHHLHHTKNGGTGKKASANTQVPLCPDCHSYLHDHGPKTFAAAFWRMLAGRTLVEWAAHYDRAYSRFTNPEKLSSIVPRVLADLAGEGAA